MWQERESCAARSPGSLWRRAKTRLATRRPSPSPASVQGTNDRPGGGTGVQKGPEGLGEPLRQVLPAAPCSQTASRTTCQPAGQWDSVPPPAPSPDRARGPRGTLGRRGRPVCLHRARALGAHRTSSTGPGNAGSSSATGSAHGGVSRACCGATRESKTLGYKGPTRSRMLHADAVPGWGSRVDAPSLTLAAASEPLSSSPGFAKAALWAVRRQRGPRGAQGRVRRDCGDLSVRRG